jgi:hypothetical protein
MSADKTRVPPTIPISDKDHVAINIAPPSSSGNAGLATDNGGGILTASSYIASLDDVLAQQKVFVIEVQSTDPNNQPWNAHSVNTCKDRIRHWTNQFDYCMKWSKHNRRIFRLLKNVKTTLTLLTTSGYWVVRYLYPDYWWLFMTIGALATLAHLITVFRNFPQRANFYKYMAYHYLDAVKNIQSELALPQAQRSMLPMQLLAQLENRISEALNDLETNKINDPELAEMFQYKYKGGGGSGGGTGGSGSGSGTGI